MFDGEIEANKVIECGGMRIMIPSRLQSCP